MRALRCLASSVFLLWLALAWSGSEAAAQEPARPAPARIKALILGSSQRERIAVDLDGIAFLSMRRSGDAPFVAWPNSAAPAIAKDPEQVRAWLERSAQALGHAELALRFEGISSWQGGERWSWSVSHRGLGIFDASVSVHWDGDVLEGICNDVPGPIVEVERPSEALDSSRSWVYHAEPAGSGVALRLAWVDLQPLDPAAPIVAGSLTRVMVAGQALRTIVRAPGAAASPDASFSEYLVPAANFPDQIDLDSSGRVWFSQPNLNRVTAFDPQTTQYRSYATGNLPDGLWIDPLDRLWTGLYGTGAGLGRFEIASQSYAGFAPPYPGATMAIPVFSRSGRVFVTDHVANRLSQFDPASSTWTASEVLPSPNVWIVQGSEDVENQTLYFTEFNVDRLARKPWNGPITEVQLPLGAGVAFDVFSRGHIYYSQWNRNRLGRYTIATGQVVEFTLPVAGELGGPIDVLPDGRVALGTRSVGYIALFDPLAQQFTMHQIPSPNSGLKDGLVVDPQGNVWFTESNIGKLGKLSLP
jgi:virginiamycin B lyase